MAASLTVVGATSSTLIDGMLDMTLTSVLAWKYSQSAYRD